MLPNESVIFEDTLNQYTLSTDRDRIDRKYLLQLFRERSPWGKSYTAESLEKYIQGSLAFGVYLDDHQVAFARVITDCSLFAYFLDVFVDENHRGRGIGTWLSRKVREHPDLATIKVWRLVTTDAQRVYERAGWNIVDRPEIMMEIVADDFKIEGT